MSTTRQAGRPSPVLDVLDAVDDQCCVTLTISIDQKPTARLAKLNALRTYSPVERLCAGCSVPIVGFMRKALAT